eukprot:scaffold282634_cov31-Tisochrysis_lutea.AAC.1
MSQSVDRTRRRWPLEVSRECVRISGTRSEIRDGDQIMCTMRTRVRGETKELHSYHLRPTPTPRMALIFLAVPSIALQASPLTFTPPLPLPPTLPLHIHPFLFGVRCPRAKGGPRWPGARVLRQELSAYIDAVRRSPCSDF